MEQLKTLYLVQMDAVCLTENATTVTKRDTLHLSSLKVILLKTHVLHAMLLTTKIYSKPSHHVHGMIIYK
eukprot:8690618-Ditylum_brightwellii.AAC.2